jgi:mannose-6-phosphate isomerase-like protein (cupin superfamily)
MNLANQKRFLYKRLMAELRGFQLGVNEHLSAPDKPWGSYIRLKETALPAFIGAYWADSPVKIQLATHQMEPKLLLVAPGKRLSLQYHSRRREYWRVIAGPVKIVLGPDGSSLQEAVYQTGDTIEIPCGYWHRIAGLSGWSVLAEIWEHTDPENPSDEEDIVRVEDDFSRIT